MTEREKEAGGPPVLRGTARPILVCGHPLLRRRAAAVRRADRPVRTLIDDMLVSMEEAPGLGLAAPQVGESLRIVVLAPQEDEILDADLTSGADEPYRLLNPRIVARSGSELGSEGCLSLPKLQGKVHRAYEVTVKALDERLRPVTIRAEGLLARVLQHEIDHLDGLLLVDRAEEGTLAWSVPDESEEDGHRLEPASREEVLEAFRRVLRDGSDPLSLLV